MRGAETWRFHKSTSYPKKCMVIRCSFLRKKEKNLSQIILYVGTVIVISNFLLQMFSCKPPLLIPSFGVMYPKDDSTSFYEKGIKQRNVIHIAFGEKNMCDCLGFRQKNLPEQKVDTTICSHGPKWLSHVDARTQKSKTVIGSVAANIKSALESDLSR